MKKLIVLGLAMLSLPTVAQADDSNKPSTADKAIDFAEKQAATQGAKAAARAAGAAAFGAAAGSAAATAAGIGVGIIWPTECCQGADKTPVGGSGGNGTAQSAR